MTPSTYLAFMAATVLLALFPGPNMALIVANSVRHGTRAGLLTLCGTTSAMAVQLALVGVGMTTLLATMSVWFDALRWLGAAYLVWIGVASWRSPAPRVDAVPAAQTARTLWARGLLVSLTNPKLLLFFGAFFPQFIHRDAPAVPQVVWLSVTFVVVAAAVDSCWALLAARMRRIILSRGRLLNRISGGLLVGTGVGLAFARAK